MRNTILPKNYVPSVIEPEIVDDTPHSDPVHNVYIQNNFHQTTNLYEWPEEELIQESQYKTMGQKMGYAYRVNPILCTFLLVGPTALLLLAYFLLAI